ncbi:MAG: OmpA family protein, partial [Parafilimonas sp.]
FKGITPHLDFSASFNYTKGTNNFKLPIINTTSYTLVTLDALLNIKLLQDKKYVTPYLIAGAGIYAQHGTGFYAPVGGGLQLNIFKSAFVHIQSQFRAPFSKNDYGNFYYQFGIATAIGKKKPKPVVIKQEPKPIDTDGDGILDKDDSCINIIGTVKYNGCPIPDSDGDGLNDEVDQCPTIAGVLKYNGCPVPDTDNDGLDDEHDSCISEAGPINNNGCPVKAKPKEEIQKQINFAARNIYFETGKSILKPESNSSLDEVAAIMSENPSLKLIISGHTDNVGKPDANLLLSKKRANAVLNYLVSKGIDAQRLSAKGFGQMQPIASNTTVEGRSQNRRVEIKIGD